jgi:hypothetical protein
MRRLARLLLGVLVLASVASRADAEVKVRFLKGTPTFVSFQPKSIVEVVAPPTKGGEVYIGVIVLNRGDQPASIGYENVTVQRASGAAVRLVGYESLQGRRRSQAAWGTFFVALAAGLNSYAAQQSSYGYVGRYRYYDPVAGQIGAARADAENGAMFATVEQKLDAQLADLDNVLRTTTVDAGDAGRGVVVFDLPRDVLIDQLVVSVTFGGEVHTIPLKAGGLQQVSAADLSMAAAASQPGVQSPQDRDSTQPAIPRCGTIQQRDGSLKLVPC